MNLLRRNREGELEWQQEWTGKLLIRKEEAIEDDSYEC